MDKCNLHCGSCEHHDWDENGTKLDYCEKTGATITCREDQVSPYCPLISDGALWTPKIMCWLEENKYLDENGTLSQHVDYDVGYDMKPDIEACANIPSGEDFDYWYDDLLEDTILPFLRSLGAIQEE